MNKDSIKDVIEAMEDAYTYILENVKPGTPGKVNAAMELRHNVNQMVYEYATQNAEEIT